MRFRRKLQGGIPEGKQQAHSKRAHFEHVLHKFKRPKLSILRARSTQRRHILILHLLKPFWFQFQSSDSKAVSAKQTTQLAYQQPADVDFIFWLRGPLLVC